MASRPTPKAKRSPAQDFEAECRRNAARMAATQPLRALSRRWMFATAPHKYTYNFRWLGRPVIQFPQDMFAMQEIVWRVRPQLIVETGVAHGGSLVFYASLLALLGEGGRVVGVDIDIRPHNRRALDRHPLRAHIDLVQGSSVDDATAAQVVAMAKGKRRVLVVLDSNHTHAHVLRELELYSPLVTKGSYLVVFDTIVEEMPAGSFPDRPWSRGNNPATAVRQFLRENRRFVVDREVENKLLISVAPNGYLRCVAAAQPRRAPKAAAAPVK